MYNPCRVRFSTIDSLARRLCIDLSVTFTSLFGRSSDFTVQGLLLQDACYWEQKAKQLGGNV